ncbi:hypothetical protein Zm00014a_035489 [Zea mays]|uniref:Uncharacterized protein n=2 Tax=Zea mays TaxID=4577 RepID=A0A8J8XU84_MAIZE|nr:survival motor neuron protein [Zea mays]PWZ23069.1 hypothetical protein Zm00014a_035489 [Zea mays]
MAQRQCPVQPSSVDDEIRIYDRPPNNILAASYQVSGNGKDFQYIIMWLEGARSTLAPPVSSPLSWPSKLELTMCNCLVPPPSPKKWLVTFVEAHLISCTVRSDFKGYGFYMCICTPVHVH